MNIASPIDSSTENVRIKNPWMILSVTSVGAFISTLNSSTLNVALPTLMKELNAPVTDVGWVVLCYMVSMTIFAIHAGKFSDLYGRKMIYITGVSILVLSSLMVGFSHSIFFVILFRTFQGIGAALMSANGTAIVVDSFPVHQRGTALGVNAMSFASGAVFGPVVGGFLVQFSWRWIFWFNVPLGIFLIFWAWKTLINYSPKAVVKPFDVWGTVTLVMSLTGILSLLTYGIDGGWSAWLVGVVLILSLFSLGLFLLFEKRAEDPILHLQVFRNRKYTIALATSFLSTLSRMNVTFILIFYLQSIRGLTPLDAGLIMIAMAGTMSVMGPVSGKLSDRIGSKLPTTAGLFISSLGLFALAGMNDQSSIPYLEISLVLIGLGAGLFQSPNTLDIMNSIPPLQRGVGSGTRMMVNNLGMLMSMSIATGMIGRVLTREDLQTHLLLEGQRADFLRTMHIIFIGGAVISILAMALSSFRDRGSKVQGESDFHKEGLG